MRGKIMNFIVPRGSWKDRAEAIGLWLLLACGAVIMMFPIYWMLRTLVATTDELNTLPVRLWPQEWHGDNYVRPGGSTRSAAG